MVQIQSTSTSVLGAYQNIERQATGFKNIGKLFENIWKNDTDGAIGYALQKVKPSLWNKNPGYMFKIVGLGNTKDVANLIGSIATEYRLQINPQQIKQSETFSIKIIPTQSGIVTENEGFVTKDLAISGTTGIFPARSTAGVTDSGFELLTGKKSGYQDFMDLRNFIRSYAELKTISQNSGAKLVFKNYKDNEFWYVEPMKFDMIRSKDKPFCYDYDIVFKIIGKPEPDVLSSIEQFFDTIDKILQTVDAATTVINSATDFLVTIEQAVKSVLLKPLQTANSMIQALAAGKTTVSGLPRKFYESLNGEVKRIRDNTCDFLGLGNPTYDNIYKRQQTLVYSGTANPLAPSNMSLLKAFSDVETAINQLIATDQYFDDNITTVTVNNEIVNNNSILTNKEIASKQASSKENILKAFNNEISLPDVNSAKKVPVLSGDTLEKIALRNLGDATRWIELVALNKLKPPYITDIREESTLISGDDILIPSNETLSKPNSYIINSRENALTLGLQSQEKILGVDLLINTEFDLVVNNRQDLELIYGFDNIYQTLYIKLGLEKGSLLYHPILGVNLAIGEKNTMMLDELYDSIRQTILSDPRFYDVTFIELIREGVTIRLSLKVILTQPRIEVPFTLSF